MVENGFSKYMLSFYSASQNKISVFIRLIRVIRVQLLRIKRCGYTVGCYRGCDINFYGEFSRLLLGTKKQKK